MASRPVPEWSSDLERKGLYFEGIVDSAVLDEVLELHKRDTVSTFGTGSSRRVAEPKKGSQSSKMTTEAQQADQKENHDTEEPIKKVRSSVHQYMIVCKL